MERSRALKKSLHGTTDAITASVDPNLASRIYTAQAKIGAKNSPNVATATTPPVTTCLPPSARTIEQLLAEVNSIMDPGDQTIWWRANYQEIKRAQQREAYAHASRPQKQFLNITLSE